MAVKIIYMMTYITDICPILQVITIFCSSKRSRDRLCIKLNDLDLSTDVGLLTFVFSTGIVPTMLGGRGWGGVYFNIFARIVYFSN